MTDESDGQQIKYAQIYGWVRFLNKQDLHSISGEMSGGDGRMAGMVAASGSVAVPHPVTVQLRTMNQYSVLEMSPFTCKM